jgi:hypothetical protein
VIGGQGIANRLRRLGRSPGAPAVIGVFAAGTAIRVGFMASRGPFLGISDSGSYIGAARGGLFSNVYGTAGYPLFIRVVHAVSAHLSLLIAAQHGLGVATAALFYLTVRGVTGSRLLGLIPAVIVLFDGFGLWVEQAPLSEALFGFLVAATLYVALRPPVRQRWLVQAGEVVLVAAATIVRPVGLILVPILGLWIFWTRGGGWVHRAVAALALVLPACGLVVAYLLVQQSDTGFFGLTRDSGRVLYARTAVFADCSQFQPPRGTAALCETIPPSRRGSANQYLTGFPDHAGGVTAAGRSISPAWRVFGPPPAGNAKLQSFAIAAIIHQPLDYLAHVADDFQYYWADHHVAFIDAAARVDPDVGRAVRSYYAGRSTGGDAGPGFLRWYGENVEVTGPLMILLLLAPLSGLVAGADRRARRAAVLLACTGWLLPLAADAVASVDPRYVLPAYGPLAAATAIGLQGVWARRGIRARRITPRDAPAALAPRRP